MRHVLSVVFTILPVVVLLFRARRGQRIVGAAMARPGKVDF